jgi:hypothetical protein
MALLILQKTLGLCVLEKANVPLWIGNCFKKFALDKKQKTSGRLEYQLFGLVNISFF